MSQSIVILITGLNFGGAEKQALIVAAGLRRRGWRVRIVSLLALPASDHRTHASGLTITSLGMSSALAAPIACARLIRLLRAEKPEVLLTFMYHANVLGRVAGRLASVPVISSVRAEHFGGRLRDLAERFTEPLSRATVVNSLKVGKALVNRRVIAEKRLRTIPNGVVMAEATIADAPEIGAVRASVNVRREDFFWLAVGRLEKPKDYATLLHAFHTLRGDNPGARLRIAGGGAERDRLEAVLDDLRLRDAVELLGFRTDIPELLAAADALVLSSAWESSPNAVLEAMAAAKLVVATDVGGVSDLIEDGRTGFLVEARDPVALARAMDSAMKLDSATRSAIGAAARKRVEVTSGEERICDAWSELLSEFRERRSRTIP